MLLSGGWAIADQAVISIANLFTTVLVARAVAPAQFGEFVMVYTTLWLLQNVQRALIVEPMNVLGANKEVADYRRYVTSTAALQVIFAVLLGGAILVAGALAPPARSLLFAFALAVVAWQLQEFVRRIFYTRTHVGAALINDGISYGGQVALLSLLFMHGSLTAVSALIAVGIARAITVVVGGWQARAHVAPALSVRGIKDAACQNWRFGRWLLGANPLWDVASRFYVLVLIAVIGPAGVGGFAAASALSRVPDMLMRSLDTLLPPIASRRLKQKSQRNMEAFLKAATLIGVVPAVISVTIVVVFAEELLHIVYGGDYEEFASVLRIVSIASLILFLSMPVRVALRSIEQTRILFIAGAGSAVVLITGGSSLAAVAGVIGAAWAAVLSAGIGLVVLAIGYRSVTRRRSARKTVGTSSE